MYKIILLFLFCLMTNISFAAPLSKTEAKAIMSNITAVVSIQKAKVVVPVVPPKPPAPDSGCVNGQCTAPTQPAKQTTTQPTYYRRGLFR